MESTAQPAPRGVGAIALVALAASLLAGGCGPAEAPWKVEPVWVDGEEAHYEVRTGDTLVTGQTIHVIEKTTDGWVVREDSTRRGQLERSEVTFDAALSPRSSWREAGESRSEVRYGEGRAVVVQKPAGGGPPAERAVSVTADVVDNGAALLVYRGLTLREGERTSHLGLTARLGLALRVHLEAEPVEKMDVPAGSFEVRCLAIRGSSARQRACYDTAPPHVLVRFDSPGSGRSLVLRAYRPAKDAAWRGDPSQPVISREPVPVSWPLVALFVLVSLPIMLGLPLWLGLRLRRRFGTDLKLWGIGAFTFVASQVVHLPLNLALGLLGPPRALGLLPLPVVAVAAGLSAGLCEELARFGVWRLALKKRGRTFPEALQLGAGHGGIEAMILGVMAAVNVGLVLLVSFAPPGWAGFSAETAAALEAKRDAFWLSPAYTGALAGVERLFAMAVHLACSVLVVRAVARRQLVWLAAAIALHTAMNAAAMWTALRFGAVAAEGATALFAGLALWIVWGLRETGRASPGEAGEPERQAAIGAGGARENT